MDFTPLRITTLRPEMNIPFGLFIHFKDQYLEYIKSGEMIESDKYKKLRKQKITKFYIVSNDEPKYQDFLDALLESCLDDANVSVEEKTEMVQGQAETAIERMQDDPASESSFDMTRKAARNLRKLIFENAEAFNQIFGEGQGGEASIIKHSLNVCALCVKFATKLGVSDEDIDYLSTAALMHDIGVTKLEDQEKKLFEKPKLELEAKEKMAYYSHCKSFLSVLADKPYINAKVITLIEAHEENLSGTGPYQKKKLELSEAILSLVNTYDKKMITEKISAPDAIKNMMIDELGNYELSMLKEFQNLLKEENII